MIHIVITVSTSMSLITLFGSGSSTSGVLQHNFTCVGCSTKQERTYYCQSLINAVFKWSYIGGLVVWYWYPWSSDLRYSRVIHMLQWTRCAVKYLLLGVYLDSLVRSCVHHVLTSTHLYRNDVHFYKELKVTTVYVVY